MTTKTISLVTKLLHFIYHLAIHCITGFCESNQSCRKL